MRQVNLSHVGQSGRPIKIRPSWVILLKKYCALSNRYSTGAISRYGFITSYSSKTGTANNSQNQSWFAIKLDSEIVLYPLTCTAMTEEA